eukprot:1727800-Pyramimonas_sp.AAC.1
MFSIAVNRCQSLHNSVGNALTAYFSYRAQYETFSSAMRAAYALKRALLLMNLMFSIAVNHRVKPCETV